MLRYLISILLLPLAAAAFGQDQEVSISLDTTKSRFIPTGIRIGVETIGIAKTFITDDYKHYAFQADIDFHRYFLNFEFGQMERTLYSIEDNGLYSIEGTYFRVGPDINFLKKDPDRSALFFGLRYASTSITDRLTYDYDNNLYGRGTIAVSNDKIRADWFEMVAGMKVKMWKMVWLGYTARFKFGVDTFEQNELIPHLIPGYGRADKAVAWDFDYYLIFRIPVRKEPKPITIRTGS